VVAASSTKAAIAWKKRRKTLAVVGAAVAALVLVGGGITAAVVLGDDDPSPSVNDEGGGKGDLTEAELDRAKRASVRLTAVGADGIPTHTGSGSIISEDGLILTNAHVGHPSAPGQGGLPEDDPAFLLVALTSEKDDTPVADAYRAEPIVSDGYLDISILQITSDGEGNELDKSELDLPQPLPIGDSDKLRTGDEITALGFPGVATANTMSENPPALTVTRGVVSTFNSNDLIGPRAEIDSDLRLGSGNSGGASINNDGEIIGLNTRVFTEALGEQLDGEGGIFTGGSARIVPVNLAEEVLQIAKEGGDESYVSPYLEELPLRRARCRPPPRWCQRGGPATAGVAARAAAPTRRRSTPCRKPAR
jgi:putative serine protease PepD